MRTITITTASYSRPRLGCPGGVVPCSIRHVDFLAPFNATTFGPGVDWKPFHLRWVGASAIGVWSCGSLWTVFPSSGLKSNCRPREDKMWRSSHAKSWAIWSPEGDQDFRADLDNRNETPYSDGVEQLSHTITQGYTTIGAIPTQLPLHACNYYPQMGS